MSSDHAFFNSGASSSNWPDSPTIRGGAQSSNFRPLTVNTNLRPKLPTKRALGIRSASISETWVKPSTATSRSRHAQTQSFSIGQGSKSPRMGKLLGAVLNAPLLNTSSSGEDGEANDIVMVDGTFAEVSASQTVTRPPSPALTADFSFVSPPSPMSFVHVVPPSHVPSGIYDVFTSPTSGPEGTPNCTLFISPAKQDGGLSYMRRSTSRPRKATLGRIWGALSSPGRRGRGKVQNIFDYLPLDGEEGELIDEACFIDACETTGKDIIRGLPSELALHILTLLDLRSVLACRSVSKYWNALACDTIVWRALFYQEVNTKGWRIDERKARDSVSHESENSFLARKRILSLISVSSRSPSDSPVTGRRLSSSHLMPMGWAPLSLDWQKLYKTRSELDRRWQNDEPKMMRISGHDDSVYCIEFDSKKIITGSRDKTIKIWDLQTGRLRATLRGHAGSVLCLKFDDRSFVPENISSSSNADSTEEPKWSGFMVSGSSDCTVLVWDLGKLWHKCANASAKGGVYTPVSAGPELVKCVLRGHSGGVLDLRIDRQWIVSCSKDGLIRVWDRKTLTLTTTLRGHEGPVNAVGLLNGKVISASGDGKMMLWDVVTGKHIRTFEGHDRGLACIEYKDDLIVSGSNDCKIKVWRASTGECLQTLVGHELLVRALSFDPKTQRLVSASYDKSVKVWDLATGKVVREFKQGHESHIFDVKFDVRRIVSTSHDQKVVVLDFGQGLDTSLLRLDS